MARRRRDLAARRSSRRRGRPRRQRAGLAARRARRPPARSTSKRPPAVVRLLPVLAARGAIVAAPRLLGRRHRRCAGAHGDRRRASALVSSSPRRGPTAALFGERAGRVIVTRPAGCRAWGSAGRGPRPGLADWAGGRGVARADRRGCAPDGNPLGARGGLAPRLLGWRWGLAGGVCSPLPIGRRRRRARTASSPPTPSAVTIGSSASPTRDGWIGRRSASASECAAPRR